VYHRKFISITPRLHLTENQTKAQYSKEHAENEDNARSKTRQFLWDGSREYMKQYPEFYRTKQTRSLWSTSAENRLSNWHSFPEQYTSLIPEYGNPRIVWANLTNGTVLKHAIDVHRGMFNMLYDRDTEIDPRPSHKAEVELLADIMRMLATGDDIRKITLVF